MRKKIDRIEIEVTHKETNRFYNTYVVFYRGKNNIGRRNFRVRHCSYENPSYSSCLRLLRALAKAEYDGSTLEHMLTNSEINNWLKSDNYSKYYFNIP